MRWIYKPRSRFCFSRHQAFLDSARHFATFHLEGVIYMGSMAWSNNEPMKRRSAWWLNHPSEKICSSNLKSSPIFGVKIRKIFELPPPWHWLKAYTNLQSNPLPERFGRLAKNQFLLVNLVTTWGEATLYPCQIWQPLTSFRALLRLVVCRICEWKDWHNRSKSEVNKIRTSIYLTLVGGFNPFEKY